MARVYSATWGAFGILVLFGTVHYSSAICFFYPEKYIKKRYKLIESQIHFFKKTLIII